MDPVTFLGSLSAAGTILAGVSKVAHDLTRLTERFRDADTTVGLLLTELWAIQGALRVVEKWTTDNESLGPVQDELASNFEMSIEGCRTAIALLEDDVTVLHAAFVNDEKDFVARLKTLWKESAMKDHQQHLRAQVQALQILIQAVQM